MILLLVIFIFSTFINASELVVDQIQIKGNTLTSSEHIKKYITLNMGDGYNLQDLEKRVKESEIQLSNLHYFYSNKILIVPLSKEKVKILVRIQEGFLYRIGGSKYGAHIGKDNFFGNGTNISTILGTKNAALTFKKNYIFNSPFHFGLSLSTLTDEIYITSNSESESYRRKSVVGFLTYSPHPTLLLQIRSQYCKTDLESAEHNKIFMALGLLVSYSFFNDILYPTKGFDFSFFAESIKSEKKQIVKYQHYFPINESLSAKLKLSIGKTSANYDLTREFTFKHFDGFVTAEHNKIRGKYAHLGEFSLRKHIYSLPFLTTKIFAEGFFQAGNINNIKLFENNNISYGLGTSLVFPMPVYTRIDSRYGISDLGNQFLFTIRAELGFFDEL